MFTFFGLTKKSNKVNVVMCFENRKIDSFIDFLKSLDNQTRSTSYPLNAV